MLGFFTERGETFVDTEQFAGTCYKAANWIYVGKTKGRGKLGPAGKQSVQINDLWLYPLSRQFRSRLTR
nr:Druantia anti-phage system protein DruA [Bathymodiolus japonicus methanotrophic gill symbiont]